MSPHQPNRFDALLDQQWFPWLDLALVMMAGIMWSVGQGLLTWQPLLIALLPWVVRLLAGRFPFRRTPFDMPMLAFLLSAGVGVWAAYNRPDAWSKFWLLVCAVVLFYALAGQPTDNLWAIVGILGFSGVLVGGYFLLTHDWQLFPAKYGPLNQLMLQWMAFRPSINLQAFPPNVAASLMAISMPLLVAWGYHVWPIGQKPLIAAVLGATGFVLAVLLVTTSRGAWIGLGIAAGIVSLAWLSRPLAQRLGRSRSLTFIFLLLLALILLMVLAVLYPGGPVALIDWLPGPASGTSRYILIQNTLDLIGDFPITGGGLRSFPGLYSQYILVTPFFFLPNGHNLFLDTTLEQGLIGVLAMAIIFFGSFILLTIKSESQKEGEQDLFALRLAVGTSLAIMLVHGLVEDTVYGSQASFFLFALPGLTVAATLPQGQFLEGSVPSAGWAVSGLLVILLLLVAAWLIATRQSPASIWLANLGAVRMAQAELADWPTNEWNDGSHVQALLPARDLFERSVAASNNRTAQYRLGLIALLQHNFERAVTHLESAKNDFSGHHQGIDKNLAYSYVWAGHYEDALGLMENIPEARDEMDVYTWWWGTQGQVDLSGHAKQMAGLLTDMRQ